MMFEGLSSHLASAFQPAPKELRETSKTLLVRGYRREKGAREGKKTKQCMSTFARRHVVKIRPPTIDDFSAATLAAN